MENIKELSVIIDFNIGQLMLLYERLPAYPKVQKEILDLIANLKEI